MSECWNTIGVTGDRSCPELTAHVHCRNCPVYERAAARLLEHESPDAYLRAWTATVAARTAEQSGERHSLLVFRVGSEWLALPSRIVKEVADRRPIHSLPHRRRGPILGLVNIRGELLVCLSLARVLGIAPPDSSAAQPRGVHSRLLVLRKDDARVVCLVDDVHGLHDIDARALQDVPATVAKGPATHAISMLGWNDRSVGVLDESVLFTSFGRMLT